MNRAQGITGNSALVFSDHKEMLALEDLDAVIIATTHDSLLSITRDAVSANKHVFVEKPAARTASELKPFIKTLEQSSRLVRVGFNHRYHRSMIKAKSIIDQGLIGDLMFIRARYGHGGRVGYDKEWRADPLLSGGGELKDQGPHIIDLCRWFLDEEFSQINGFAHTYFWNMPVDDNAFLMLKTPSSRAASIHVSCTEWKNTFSMEIYGQLGKLDLNGLGGSYGIEKLTWYKMLKEMGPPETTSWEYPMPDNSWCVELEEFCLDITSGRSPNPNLFDAYQSLQIIDQIYKESDFDYCS